MGKRKKRLHSKKYAKKYASVRATIARLRGEVVEAIKDDIVTPIEEEKITKAVEQVVEATKEIKEETPVAPTPAPVVQEPQKVKAATKAPVVQKAIKKPVKATQATRRKTPRTSK